VDFVTDFKVTVNAFNTPQNDVTEFGHVITTCRNLFYSHFANSRIEFSRRQANVAAHVLTREVMLSASLIVYFDVPDCIDSIIINKMLHASFFKIKKKM
jgi:hypothetical protein